MRDEQGVPVAHYELHGKGSALILTAEGKLVRNAKGQPMICELPEEGFGVVIMDNNDKCVMDANHNPIVVCMACDNSGIAAMDDDHHHLVKCRDAESHFIVQNANKDDKHRATFNNTLGLGLI